VNVSVLLASARQPRQFMVLPCCPSTPKYSALLAYHRPARLPARSTTTIPPGPGPGSPWGCPLSVTSSPRPDTGHTSSARCAGPVSNMAARVSRCGRMSCSPRSARFVQHGRIVQRSHRAAQPLCPTPTKSGMWGWQRTHRPQSRGALRARWGTSTPETTTSPSSAPRAAAGNFTSTSGTQTVQHAGSMGV